MLVTSGTYAYLEMKKNASVAGSAKCNGINYQGQEINASNLSSTTNYLEGAKSTITLSQSEDCKIYSYVNIYLHTNDNITAPIDSVKALKYKLITEDKIEYNGTITTKGDSLLAVVPLTSNPKSYQVYLWIDSGISNGQFDNKSFSGYIYATSEQSSTIGEEEISNNENVSIETIDFDYVGREQEFIVPVSGDYKLETWGAQGGSYDDTYYGGYGAYSVGELSLNREKIYINVGQNGSYCKTKSTEVPCSVSTSYNGGGGCFSLTGYDTKFEYLACGSGGGATHLSFHSGLLSTMSSSISDILVVSGGGGGFAISNTPYNCGAGGSAGGITGNSSIKLCMDNHVGEGGKYDKNFRFGFGYFRKEGGGGGGSGMYGGYGHVGGGGGGSSYIGNSLLTNKAMYCYNCEESDEVETKTISTTNVSDDAISGYAKKGNGYARITLIK